MKIGEEIIKYKKIIFLLLFLNLSIIFSANFDPDTNFSDQTSTNDFELKFELKKDIVYEPSQDEHEIFNCNPKVSSSVTPKNAYAIVIGISDYPGTGYDLSYCDDDSNAIYSLLTDDYNFKPENVIYLQDSNASKSAISNALDQVASNISEDDIFFFYYSGHGGFGTEIGPYYWIAETPHPYDNYFDQTWSVSRPGAAYMRVHFYRFDCEYYYDYALCGDSDVATGWYYEVYSGNYGYNFWSAYIPVDRYYIRFISDFSVTDYGFKIDKYEAIVDDGTHYLCSFDSIPNNPSNYYIDTLLDSKLDNINCTEKYIVIDSCHSGGMIPEVQDIGRYIMTACDHDESSLETSSLHHGVFSYYFLNSFENATDTNGDGVKSMEECFSYTYSNTVSYSGSLGYTHHPQEYDGIIGDTVLYPSFGSVTFNPSGNELTYSFTIYGSGLIEELYVAICSVSQDINFESKDLLENPTSLTGFGDYSGTIQLEGSENLTGYGIFAKLSGNKVILLNSIISNDTDADNLDDLFEIIHDLDPTIEDCDSDGLNDGEEYYGDSDPLIADTDSDGLLDGAEVNVYYTNVTNPDTDTDGIFDGYEINCGLNPFLNDSLDDEDNDGLINLLEFQLGSNANNSDSDDDKMPDIWEYFNGLNLIYNDAHNDFDGDGLDNLLEFQLGSKPNDLDSDDDKMPDIWEYINGLNLIYNDAHNDFDGDGLDNLLEFQLGSMANNSDSDSDNMPDFWEYNNDLNLTFNDAHLDGDYDGLINLDEYNFQTDPQNPDTDGDLYLDGIEVLWGTDPLNPYYSLNSIFLNIIGIAVIAVTGYYIHRKYNTKKRKIEEIEGKFEIDKKVDNYNVLRVEIKTKPIPPKPIYRTTIPYERVPSYKMPYDWRIGPEPNIQIKRELIKDFILNKLPPPKSSYSIEGKRATQIALASLKFVSEGRVKESLDAMMLALQLGVPEPLNNQIKQFLLSTLDSKFDISPSSSLNVASSYKKCKYCGKINFSGNEFCIKCGRRF